MAFHPIGAYVIQGAEQAIQERHHPQVALGMAQRVRIQCLGLEVLVGLAVIGEDRGQRVMLVVKAQVAQAVLRSDSL